jgi:hypothetical protein
LQEAVERSGAEMLVALFPTKELVALFPTKEEVHRPLLGDDQGESWGILVKPFVAAFERLGIRYLDPTPILQERATQGERLFFEVDVHPNAKGYRLIADAVAERLEKLAGLGGRGD